MKLPKKLAWISLGSIFMIGIVISTVRAEGEQCDPAQEQSVCL